jgi:GNAT superfamily N-acetyltransferase
VLGDVAVELRGGGQHATLGYTFAGTSHGKGYAREAVAALVDALCAAGVHRFVATLDPLNVPSMRLLEAVGFTYESLARKAEFIRGEWVDDLRYSMLASERAEWLGRPRTRAESVELVEITPGDPYLWGRLRTHHSQERFVSPMALSFRDALFPEEYNGGIMVPWLRGVLADGERVGFVMMGMVTEHHPEPYLWRLLIDRVNQRRGLGTQVLELVIAQVREWGHNALTTSWGEGPGSPEPFYLRHGFVPTGEMDDDEVIGRLSL